MSDLIPEQRERSMQIQRLLLQACSLWSLEGVTSPKARHAIRAIERFLLQDSKIRADFDSSTAVGSMFTTTDGTVGDFISSSVQPEQKSKFAFEYGTLPSDNVMGDLRESFNIVQDPMFQDLFGPSYYMPDTLPTDWT